MAKICIEQTNKVLISRLIKYSVYTMHFFRNDEIFVSWGKPLCQRMFGTCLLEIPEFAGNFNFEHVYSYVLDAARSDSRDRDCTRTGHREQILFKNYKQLKIVVHNLKKKLFSCNYCAHILDPSIRYIGQGEQSFLYYEKVCYYLPKKG